MCFLNENHSCVHVFYFLYNWNNRQKWLDGFFILCFNFLVNDKVCSKWLHATWKTSLFSTKRYKPSILCKRYFVRVCQSRANVLFFLSTTFCFFFLITMDVQDAQSADGDVVIGDARSNTTNWPAEIIKTILFLHSGYVFLSKFGVDFSFTKQID